MRAIGAWVGGVRDRLVVTTRNLGAPAAPASLRLFPLRASPDPQRGGHIMDTRGREVLLRGVNVNALVDYWKGTPFPTAFPLVRTDPDLMAAIGWNAVRLLLSWSRIEPAPGRYDDAYLDEAARLVDTFERRGMYTIIDLHQDAWSASLAARPAERCAPEQRPALGWDGAPAWATLDGGLPRCYTRGREDSPAVRSAWASFFADAPGPGGVGLQARYVAMLRHVARRFARSAAVAGFDIINEPNAALDEMAQLSHFYAAAITGIRAGERDGGGFGHLVLFEPSNLTAAPLPDFKRDSNGVYAPHIYQGGFGHGQITRAAFETARAEARHFGGVPVISGEWGTSPDRATDSKDHYFIAHQDLQDEFHFGAALWTFHESCGDPGKVEAYRAGQVARVWGLFDVDCHANKITGARAALVRQLTRGYVRAAPGRLLRSGYDDANGTLHAEGEASAGMTGGLVAFYPRAKHGGMRVGSTGLTAVQLINAPGDGRYITAVPRGGHWTLHVTPR